MLQDEGIFKNDMDKKEIFKTVNEHDNLLDGKYEYLALPSHT